MQSLISVFRATSSVRQHNRTAHKAIGSYHPYIMAAASSQHGVVRFHFVSMLSGQKRNNTDRRNLVYDELSVNTVDRSEPTGYWYVPWRHSYRDSGEG
jgi:hypothetical protein